MAKQIKVREDNYFAVQGWMVTELKLKGNALMLYAIIYGFSQTTNTAFTGSVDYLCEWLGGVSRPTVINTLDNLVKQELLTKSSTTKGALIYNSYTALRPVSYTHLDVYKRQVFMYSFSGSCAWSFLRILLTWTLTVLSSP